ncbi:MAG: peptide/nickel transport system permease protein [Chloroflexota bacterium]|nr:peptide/nickel transport system permease protein [Chloroflexota bacterium]
MADLVINDSQVSGLIGEYTERTISKTEKFLGPELYRILRGVFTNPLSIIGFSLIMFFILVAVFAPQIAPPLENARDPYKILRDGFSPYPKEPGADWVKKAPELPAWYEPLTGKDHWVHFFGTASGGWDLFYGVVWGTRTAIKVGVLIEGITLLLGILIGSLAGFYGGWLDTIIMRITEIFQTFPFILSAMTLSAILTPIIGKGLWPATIALVVFGWMSYARLIRGDILSVRERDYVMAARVVGATDSRIMFQHIIPNAIYPTLVVASLDIGSVVVSFAALSFLGIGTEVGYADWGQLVSFARNWIPQLSKYWWILIYPGVALVLFVLGWNLVGDALRDIMDPRMRGNDA